MAQMIFNSDARRMMSINVIENFKRSKCKEIYKLWNKFIMKRC